MEIHSGFLEMGTLYDGREEHSWKLAAAQYRNGIRYNFFTAKRNELENLGYTLLGGFAGHNKVMSSLHTKCDAENTYPKEAFLDLLKYAMKTLPGEEVLCNEPQRTV